MTTQTAFPIQFTSNTFYVLAFFPAVVAVGLVYAATRLSPSVLYAGFAVIPAVLAILFVLVAHATNNMSVRVGEEGIVMKTGLRARVIPLSSVRRDGVRQVDLATHPELQPVRRTNGSEMAGLKEGWFRLQNGEKALVALTNPAQAVYIPTTEGYSLLVSPADAASFFNRVMGGGKTAIVSP